ncbi:MAG: carboxypeptidase regulatory-like domain-containing protein [Terriglobales bacterium]|jgi:hypothetical protein
MTSFPAIASSGVGGSISGTVKDKTGSSIVDAKITLQEVGTGLSYSTRTDGRGYYRLPVLPVGEYDLTINASGFNKYQRTQISLDTDAALTLDAILEVGTDLQTVTVTDETIHVETTSTQMGEVISGRQMTAVPLNGRSFTDLLSLQPGVAPETSITSTTVQDVGATVLQPSGALNPGTVSVNGQREFANAFEVNGGDAEEDVNAGTSIVPNLDSIAEFRIVTNNFDAEHGEFSGGQILVITKSGDNAFHGSAFEFLRNTDLDARNYFSPTRGLYQQNQFGGTFGGPVRRDKLFFFADYQGTRQTQGIDTGTINVPSNADRAGNLSDLSGNLTGVVSGPYLAGLLSQRLGYGITAGEAYYTPNCASSILCVFPNAIIPTTAWSGPAQKLLQYIPTPNTSANTFSTSSYNQTVRDDKGAARLDSQTSLGLVSAYYFLDNYTLDNPYPVTQSGASVPGFNALTTGQAQLFTLGDTKTVGNAAVNEFHASYLRNYNDLGQPVGGRGVSLASQGFLTGQGTPSIVPLDPKGQSVENIVFNTFSIGAAANELKQASNTYEIADNFSKVLGSHSLKVGGNFHIDQVNAAAIAQFNGNFVFAGSETGSDFADFLIGVPSQYNQSQLNPFYARNKYLGLFAQDTWRVGPNFTLNYGLRWDHIEPWTEKYNEISTFIPGEQSVTFPSAPLGILFPTDPGVPRTLAPIQNFNFSPRIGFAWSPQISSDGLLGRIFGSPGSTSIRAGFGNYYSAIEALTIGVLAANAPYGTTYTSPAPPLFSNPFITASNGQNFGQPFPYTFAPRNSSSSNPDTTFDWSNFLPISGIPGYNVHNKVPYTEEWMLSIERQLGANTVLSASYVGNQGHRQLVLIEANPGDPALCLSLSRTSQVSPGSATCGPFGENNVYTRASGQIVNGTRGPLGPNFGSVAYQSTIGNSNYNALELSARHTSERLEFFGSYTYSKALDLSSNIGDEVNPTNPALSYALSSFDVTHNFVLSYEYQLPFDQLAGKSNRATSGWKLSGITRISSGFPVTLVNNGDNSLLGTNPNGVNNSGIDLPDYSGAPLNLNNNPRNGQSYFNTSAFTNNALGTPGTARRRFFFGPGATNFDLALSKNLPLTESKAMLFRIEAFNLFNHAEFNGPSSVDGNIDSATFGKVISAAPARVMQAAVKLTF